MLTPLILSILQHNFSTVYIEISVVFMNPNYALSLFHQCLLDHLLAVERSQVMIPFDASMEPKDIKKHLITTISRVVAKVV